MNKKVLTLCAGALLAGGVSLAYVAPVNAALPAITAVAAAQEEAATESVSISDFGEMEGVTVDGSEITLSKNVKLEDNQCLLIDEAGTVLNGGDHILTGHIAITANNVTVKDLTVEYESKGSNRSDKAGILVGADTGTDDLDINNVTIDGVTLKGSAEGIYLANGISIRTTNEDAVFTIKDCEITTNNKIVNDNNDFPVGILIYGTKTPIDKMVVDCTINSAVEITQRNADGYIYAKVDADKIAEGEDLSNYMMDVLNSAKKNDAQIEVANATGEEVINALASWKGSDDVSAKDKKAVIIASDQNLLFGDATAPDNGNPSNVVMVNSNGTVSANKASAAELLGEQKLVSKVGNDYYLLAYRVASGTMYVAKGDISVEKYDGSQATDDNFLWSVKESTNAVGEIEYVFTNKATGEPLTTTSVPDGEFNPVGNIEYNNGFVLELSNGDGNLNGTDAFYWGLYEAGELAFTADDLNEILKPGFGMTIKIAKDNDKAIEGVEVFGKTMYAVEIPGSNAVKIVDKLDKDGTVADDANYLVLDKAGWDGISANSQLNGEFIWVSGKDLVDTDLNKNWYDEFEFLYSASKEETDILTRLYVPGVDASAYILSVNGINYLTTKKDISGTETWPYIKLAPQNIVDVKTLLGKYWNITFAEKTVANENEEYKLNGGVVAVIQREGGTAPKADYVKASSVLLTSPEAQWGVVEVSGSTFTLQNRENPEVQIKGVTLRYDEATKLYTIYTSNSELDGDEVTLTSHTITGTLHMDGFMTAKPAELRDKVFHIGQYHYETGNSTAFWAENHQANRSHQLGVVTDEETAVDWRLSIEMQKDRDNLETAYADTMYVITKLAALNSNGGIDNYKAADTLAILQYKFQNKGNLEYVIFNDAANQKYYQCQEDESVEATALHFALKLKPDSTYNVVSVVENKGKRADQLGAEKIYVANSQQWGSLKQMPTYGEDNNSLMQVIPVDRPEYRKVQMAWGDTIKLWRNENESEVLYEQRNDKAIVADKALSFLNIENENDPKFDINPALFVDTAYINRWDADGVKNTCYQYLLVVNPKNVSEYYCPLTPEHNTDAWREANGGPCPDAKKSTYVEGRFLVNMIDTANVYGLEHLHNNPYINRTEEGADRAKLAFVDGIHAGDTLYLFRGNGDTIKLNLNTPDFNVAKFAFKYEDVEEGSFKIQTQYKDYLATNTSYTEAKDFAEAYEKDIHGDLHHNEGYLRWTNGCIVVDENYQKGDVFNMTERYTEQNPTANETITAEGAVSVVATDGAVVIKGAEGKNVVIATILGKVVANETINSDNETIAVPAGIAVVSVDGESFKVVVK